MAAERFLDESDSDLDQPAKKRIKSRPSFASVIGEVVMVNSLQNFCSALEPVLRKVVNEEFERGLSQRTGSLSKSTSFRIESIQNSTLRLIFSKNLMQPIFTSSKITDSDNNPLQIMIVDANDDSNAPVNLYRLIKLDIVALDGDFPHGDNWSSKEFESKILKERDGKRPLLAGEVNVTLRNGIATIGEIEFTDNSSWIRGRKFRIGVRISKESFQGVRIKEGITEAFVVRDHRGELYKKHHPPMLEDEVWRLEKIGKDGAFHKKLSSENINTVQDFLKLSVVDPGRLKRILGQGMSEKMWEATTNHARECVMGNRYYILRGPNFVAFFNPICQLVKAVIDGRIFQMKDMTNINRGYVENLIRQAYANWVSLEQIEGSTTNDTAFLTQGDTVGQKSNGNHHHGHHLHYHQHHDHHHNNMARSNDDREMIDSGYVTTPFELGFCFSITESSKGAGNEEESNLFWSWQ